MAASRVVIRNTFIDLEATAAPPRRSCRARSDDGRRYRDGVHQGFRMEKQLDNLNALVQEWDVHAKPALTDVAVEGPQLEELKRLQGILGAALSSTSIGCEAPHDLCGKLAEPGSNTSISTMASEKDVPGTPDTEESEGTSASESPLTAARRRYNGSWAQLADEEEEENEDFVLAPYVPPSPAPSNKPVVRPSKPSRRVHHTSPKNLDLAEEFAKTGDQQEPTTMMIRNIPNTYTQALLIAELAELGFDDTYDFLYLPIDKNTAASIGYAFVNFKEPASAARCMIELDNYRFKSQRRRCSKIATVSVAYIQGLEKNLAHYENTEVRAAKRRQRRPVVLGAAGWRSSS